MNCKEAKRLLPTLDQGDLSPKRTAALRSHLDSCAPCRRLEAEYVDTLRLLSSYEAPPLPSGFGSQLHARLEAQVNAPPKNDTRPLPALEEEPRRRRALRALVTLAAGLAVGVFSTWGIQRATRHEAPRKGDAVRQAGPPSTTLKLGQVAVVTLSLETTGHHPDAELEVVLPDGLGLVGEGLVNLEEKVLRWVEPLRPGTNLIRVPVRALRPGRWELVARARTAGRELGTKSRLQVSES